MNIITADAYGKISVDIRDKLFENRILLLNEDISKEVAEKFLLHLMYLASRPEPVHIIISSYGGEVDAGMLIIDAIESFPGEINLYAGQIAASMAAIIFACGKAGNRFIFQNSKVMIHEVRIRSTMEKTATGLSSLSTQIGETRDKLNRLLSIHTGKSIPEIEDATSFDNYMNAEEAVEFGIADKIVSAGVLYKLLEKGGYEC